MSTSALDRVIEILGSQDALATALDIKSPSISGWRARNKVPAERCIDIENATGGKVTRYQLRPDVFGQPPARRPTAAKGETAEAAQAVLNKRKAA